MDRPGVGRVSEGSGKQGKMEETGCKIICDASTILAVKGQMMMMMMSTSPSSIYCQPFQIEILPVHFLGRRIAEEAARWYSCHSR